MFTNSLTDKVRECFLKIFEVLLVSLSHSVSTNEAVINFIADISLSVLTKIITGTKFGIRLSCEKRKKLASTSCPLN